MFKFYFREFFLHQLCKPIASFLKILSQKLNKLSDKLYVLALIQFSYLRQLICLAYLARCDSTASWSLKFPSVTIIMNFAASDLP